MKHSSAHPKRPQRDASEGTALRRLAERGLILPTPPPPGGAYLPVRVLCNVAYVAAQFPFQQGRLAFQGRLGQDLTTQDGQQAAALCALNVLAHIHAAVGLENVEGLGHFEAALVTAEGWDDFPRVVDGASNIFNVALGDAGVHARSLVGVHRLPLGAPVELTAVFHLRPSPGHRSAG